jgi:RNA polymerase sigma-70 factor (ECF subfamily)
MVEAETRDELREELRSAWHHFVDALAPQRPALHGYCRRLAGNVWDAEDLVQDTLLRAFGHWGVTAPAIRNPRAYLLRTATNVWIDTLRRRRREPRAGDASPDELAAPETSATVREVRDAGSQLLQRLSPQERAAVLLKEGFDMTLEEIAELLATTTGAVKAALHRGRSRLHEAEPEPDSPRALPSPALLDRFIERYEARDVPGLLELLLDGATAENLGNSYHVGLDSAEGGVPRFLRAVVHGHPEWPGAFQRESRRLARADFEGEPILLGFATHRGREALEAVLRIEEREGRITRIRAYGFCPETMREIGETLGVPVRTGIYRAPAAAPATPAG